VATAEVEPSASDTKCEVKVPYHWATRAMPTRRVLYLQQRTYARSPLVAPTLCPRYPQSAYISVQILVRERLRENLSFIYYVQGRFYAIQLFERIVIEVVHYVLVFGLLVGY
jgi:hypothetical protein